MTLKKENPLSKNRTELLSFLQQMDVLTSTKLSIGRLLEGMSDELAEKRANQIFCKIVSCKTESELLDKLKKI